MSSLLQQYRSSIASDKIVASLRDSTEKLTPEQEWDRLNDHLYDPETLAEIQAETEQ